MKSNVGQAGMVSIIIPAYNASAYIAKAISSVLDQTYKDFEIIVVDDGSQDDTSDIVQAIADERVFLYRHDTNKGVAAARNTGIGVARGRWLAFLDADDRWMPQRLEHLIAQAKVLGEGYFVADDILICLERHGELRPWRTLFQNCRLSFDNSGYMDMGMAEFLAVRGLGIQPVVPADVVKKHAITFTEGCSYGEDIEFYCRLFHVGLRLRLLDEALYIYVKRSGSLSMADDRAVSLKGVYERLLSLPGLDPKEAALLRKKLAVVDREQIYMDFSNMLKSGRFLDASRAAIKNPYVLFRLFRRLPSAVSYYITWKR